MKNNTMKKTIPVILAIGIMLLPSLFINNSSAEQIIPSPLPNSLFIYAGGYTTNKVYQYWTSNLTKKAETASYGGDILCIAKDSNYIYVGGTTTNKVYQYWTSNLTKKSEGTTNADINDICSDNTYVYAGLGGAGHNLVYQFWVSNMTKKAETASYGGAVLSVLLDSTGTYLYIGGATTRKVYQYWTSNLTKKAESLAYSASSQINSIIGNDTYLYVGGGGTQKVYQYWTSNLTKKAETADYGGTIASLSQDDTYIYAGGATTQKVYQYWTSNLTKKAETADYGGIIYNIKTDKNYIYAGGATTQKVYQYWTSNLTKKAETADYGGLISSLEMSYATTPTVTTNDATGVEETNATLQGTLTSDGGEPSSCRFQYGLTTSYGTTTLNQTKTTGQTFSQNINQTKENLSSGFTTVHGISGAVSRGQSFTATETYTIIGVSIRLYQSVPSANYFKVSLYNTASHLPTGAILTSSINPSFTASATAKWYYFYFTAPYLLTSGVEYAICCNVSADTYNWNCTSTDSSYTGGTALTNSGTWATQTGDNAFKCYKGILSPGTLYHYRAVANNTAGTSYGADKTFITKPNEPTGLTITNTAPQEQTITWTHGTGYNTTVLRGNIGGYPTDPTDGIEVYNGTGNSVVNAGLTGGDQWYYRAWEYTVWGTLHQFSDNYIEAFGNALDTPIVTTNDATGTTTTNATLQGLLDDDMGEDCYVRFEYGLTALYGTTTANQTKASAETFNQNTIGLTPGTTYHYRAVANNTVGTGYGADKTFTTTTTPTGSFNATRIFSHYCDLNATILDDGQGTPDPYIIGCNARIQILNATTYPNWNKAKNTTWSGYKTDGQKTYWNHTLLPSDPIANDRPGMKYYYRLQLNNTYYHVNYTAKTFISQPEDLTSVQASPDYDDLTSRLKMWWSGGGAEYYNKTVIRYSTTNYPTTPSDGTLLFNSTEWDEWMLNWTSPTQYNSMIYLSIWRWSTWGGLNTYSNVSRAVVKTPAQYQTRVFLTNNSLVTPTTMRVWCTVKSGGLPCWLRAEYGLTTAYASSTSYKTGITNGTNYFDITGLTPGKLYYIRMKINNTATTNYSNSKIPIPYYVNTNTIDPDTYWTGGYLPEYVFLYNRTLSSRCINTTYQPYAGSINEIWAWNYTTSTWKNWIPGGGCTFSMFNELRPLWMKLTSNFTQTIKLSDWGYLTRPQAPNITSWDIYYDPLQPIGESPLRLRINWTKGTGANNTVIISNPSHQPTTPADGTIRYNHTGSTTSIGIYENTPCYVTLFSFTTWTYNPTISLFNLSGATVNWSYMIANCYNESNPSQEINPFNIQFKDETGLYTYTAMGVTSPYTINISNIPIGTDILIKCWATGYQSRIMYQTITNSTYLNITFYLPPLETNGTGGGTEDCVTRTHTNSINISNPNVDATITFSHPLTDMIQIERYNGSIDSMLRTGYDSTNITDVDINHGFGYTTNDDENQTAYSYVIPAVTLKMLGQTFTPYTDFTASNISMKLSKHGTVSAISIAIYSNYFPSGSPVSTGTIDPSAITTSSSGAWYSINLTSYSYSSGQTYCIAISATVSGSGDYVAWRDDGSSPTFAQGNAFQGVLPTPPPVLPIVYTNLTKDFMFNFHSTNKTMILDHPIESIIIVEVYNTSIDRTRFSYTDTATITSYYYTHNLYIPLTETLANLISVEVYNKSVGGGYGAWMPVPTTNYTFITANNTMMISHYYLASNTTMARVNYYYWINGTYGGWQYISASYYSHNGNNLYIYTSILDPYMTMIRVTYYWIQTGSQGTWQYIPDTWYTYNTTRVTINTSAMDDYTTMIRTTYYWEDCEGQTTTTSLYYCRVVETIKTEYSEFDRPVINARVWFQTYISTIGHYVNVSTLITDGNGYVSVYLIPENLYQIIITKDGYDKYTGTYQPPPPNQYFQTVEKIFRIERTAPNIPVVDYKTIMDGITWSIEPTWWRQSGAFPVYFNITSTDCNLQWYRIDVYNYNYTTNTWTLYGTDNHTDACGGTATYIIPNATGKWTVEAWFKKTNFTAYEVTQEGSFTYFITQVEQWFSEIPDYAFYIVILVIMLIVMGYCMMQLGTGLITGYIGLGIMALGFLLHPVTLEVSRDFSISGWAIWGITFMVYTIGLFIYSRI